MRDKRTVDDLSIEELERVLAVKRREARQQHMEQMRRSGRVVDSTAPVAPAALPIDPENPQSKVKLSVDPVTSPRLAAMERLAMIDQGLTPVFDDEPDASLPITSAPPLQPRPILEPRPVPDHPSPPHLTAAPAVRPPRRNWMDRVLLLVEVAAVVGIVAIGFNFASAIGKLEQETASAQALQDEVLRAGIPTIEPTPTLRLDNIVLPGGHTPPTAPQGAQFNYEEVPAIYRPLVQSQWIQPVISRPPVTRETALSVNIPRMQLDATIVQGVDWEALKAGVGQLPNGVNPGDVEGNVVLAAHNDIYGELFRTLDQLQVGDPFQIRTASQVYNYSVTDTLIVEPNDVYVMDNRRGSTVTLISCYPYQVNTQRIVIYAQRAG